MSTQRGEEWLVLKGEDGYLHTIPKHDQKSHVARFTCWCRPTDDDGVIVHHEMRKVLQ